MECSGYHQNGFCSYGCDGAEGIGGCPGYLHCLTRAGWRKAAVADAFVDIDRSFDAMIDTLFAYKYEEGDPRYDRACLLLETAVSTMEEIRKSMKDWNID